jgi:homoserine O-acetyltransferase
MGAGGQGAPVLFELELPGVTLEAGAHLERHVVRGWCWGPAGEEAVLAARARVLDRAPWRGGAPVLVQRGPEVQAQAEGRPAAGGAMPDPAIPTVLLVHALTGDMRAGGPGGWWEPVLGPGRALDPGRCRLLCVNNLGSCYGTSGPRDAGFPRRTADRHHEPLPPSGRGAFHDDEAQLPATVTTWDQARSLLMALDALGIGRVHLVAGGSLGGMIGLCLGVLAPQRVERIAAFGAAVRASPWLIGWNHVGRRAVLADPGFPHDGGRGLELARQLAHLTYRAEPGLEIRHGRRLAPSGIDDGPERTWSPRAAYAVQTYLEHHGQKLRRRFDARAYLCQLGAMDHHDLGRLPSWQAAPADGAWGVERLTSSLLAVGIDSDALFSPGHLRGLAEELASRGVTAEYAEIRSPHGHDSFLIEWDQVAALLRRAMAMPAPDRRTPDNGETR